MREKICLALDVDRINDAKDLIRRLSPWVGIFKIGSHLFTSGEGRQIVSAIHESGAEVFLDLKFHDIPNTVVGAARKAVDMGVYMFNVHALGGSTMMRMVAEGVRSEAEKLGRRKPLVLAVTILTSMSRDDLRNDLLIDLPLDDYILHLARLAKTSGLDGVVCSPREITLIKEACGEAFVVVTPGIRPAWSVAKDDQKRVTTPREAIRLGADYIVVGRPVLKAESPEEAAEKLLAEASGE